QTLRNDRGKRAAVQTWWATTDAAPITPEEAETAFLAEHPLGTGYPDVSGLYLLETECEKTTHDLCVVTARFEATSMDNPDQRAVGHEIIRDNLYSETEIVYQDINDNYIGNKPGEEGLPALRPLVTIVVDKIQRHVYRSNMYGFMKTRNDVAFSTPKGTQLAASAGILLFVGAQINPLDNGNYQVLYEFLVDPDNLHNTTVFPRDEDKGILDLNDPTTHELYETANYATLIPDES
ncbi:unnamed protein product, partial [marine sediment metagenome]